MSADIANIIKGILSEYHDELDLALVPIGLDWVKGYVERNGFAKTIILERYDYPDTNIASQIGFFPDKDDSSVTARIQFSKSLNYCWRRFAVCKELYHCIIDEDLKNRITNIEDLSTLMEYVLEDASAILDPFPAHQTEIIAEILAIETLMPLELRSRHKGDYDSGIRTAYDLALRYCIPEKYASLAMYPSYYKSIMNLRKDKLVDVF